MNVAILMALDVDDSVNDKKCPNSLYKPSDLSESYRVTFDGPITSNAYVWMAQAQNSE